MITATHAGAVTAYHNGSVKLATTSTGIDVTGTVTADGLTVDGDGTTNVISGGGSNDVLAIKSTDNTSALSLVDTNGSAKILTQSDGRLHFYRNGDANSITGANSKLALGLEANGDISFYEDTGTTPKFFWDASAEGLSLGHTGNTSILDVLQSDNITDVADVNSGAKFGRVNSSGNGQTSGLFLLASGNGGSNNGWAGMSAVQPNANSNNADLTFITRGSSIAERMRIDSSGNVGIGTSSPRNDAGTTTLEVSGSTTARLIVQSTGTGGREYGWYASIDGQFGLYDYTASSERMRIDSSGNVGIGTSSPSEKLHVNSGGGNVPALFESTDSLVLITFKDNGTSTDVGIGADDNNLVQYAGGAERMRIDSSGNLLVGSTNNSPATNNVAGSSHGSLGNIQASVDGNPCLFVNRKTNDGDIISIRKDGSAVASIGTKNGALHIGSTTGSDSYLGFYSNQIIPTTNDGSDKDAVTDLGYSGSRFKDLYLSGGVYLGGTGSGNPTNKLDDYEAGDFNASLTPASGSISVDASYNKLLYTKVGRLVTITGRIKIGSVSSASGAFYLTLPFTSINFAEEADYAALTLLTYGVDLDAGVISTFGEVSPNSTECYAYQQRDNNPWIALDASGLTAGDILYFTGTYTAA
jgi:hypothetical protein